MATKKPTVTRRRRKTPPAATVQSHDSELFKRTVTENPVMYRDVDGNLQTTAAGAKLMKKLAVFSPAADVENFISKNRAFAVEVLTHAQAPSDYKRKTSLPWSETLENARDVIKRADILTRYIRAKDLMGSVHAAFFFHGAVTRLAIDPRAPDAKLGRIDRVGRREGGAERARARRQETAERTKRIQGQAERLQKAGRANREIAGILAIRFKVTPATIRKHLRKKPRA